MKYLVTHYDTIEAESEEEALSAYEGNWKDGDYDKDDCEIHKKEKGE